MLYICMSVRSRIVFLIYDGNFIGPWAHEPIQTTLVIFQ